MNLLIDRSGTAHWRGRPMRCALGRRGVAPTKREGDGVTPAGTFFMRCLFYRPDREAVPQTALPCRPLRRDDGWCDAPADIAYNRHIRLPYSSSAETLWRDDRLYDLIVPMGYNDDPVVPGMGSAIFLHLAAAGFTPTEGCIALARADLLAVIASADPASRVIIV